VTPAGRSSTGIDENLAGAITYLFGFITGIGFLMIEKDSDFVRFHARQSTVVFVGVLVLDLVLWAVPLLGMMLVPLFTIAVIGLWLFLMYKAVSGERYKLPYIGDMADRISG
jgi:uncharacterized membrane protein